MSAIDRGIGSEGLEQGGPNLGNDYSRKDLGLRNAGDALTHPETGGLGSKEKNEETLNMDQESSRNLSGETSAGNVTNANLEDDDLEDDDLTDLDDDDDDLDEMDKGL